MTKLSAALSLVVLLWPAFADAQTPKAGTVTTLEGRVTAARIALPQPVALKFKDDVFLQDRISTEEGSLARLLLGGKAVITIRERSALTITEVPGVSTVTLDAGKVGIAVARDRMAPGERVQVRTPNAIAAVRGTAFMVETDAPAPTGGLCGSLVHVFTDSVEATPLDPATGAAIGPPVVLSSFQRGCITGSSVVISAFRPEDAAGLAAGLQPRELAFREPANAPELRAVSVETTVNALAAFQAAAATVPPGDRRPATPAAQDTATAGVTATPLIPQFQQQVTVMMNGAANGGMPNGAVATGLTQFQVTWGAGASDLDLHLTGPQNGNRFHVFFASPGSLTSQPFARLNQDCVCINGSEVITVQQFNQGGPYRASVFNFGNQSTQSTNLSTASEAEFSLITGGTAVPRTQGSGSTVVGGTVVATVRPPAGQAGNTWVIGTIDPATGAFTPVNQITNSPNSGSVAQRRRR